MKNKMLGSILLLALCIQANGQDIYDAVHSKQYADHLFKSKNYIKASAEYERTCFLDSQNWDAHFKLIQSYRKSNQPDKGLDHWNKVALQVPPDLLPKFEHQKNICVFDLDPLYFATQQQPDTAREWAYFKTPSLLLTHNWQASNAYIGSLDYKNDKTLNSYYNNSMEGLRLIYKKPWLAGSMSAIVPGLGKAYTGYYKDGLVAFVFTGLSAFQAYRGYKAKGAASGIFIIYSGVTAGFYIGNIYGSVKSARQKNKKLNSRIDNKTRDIFYDWAE